MSSESSDRHPASAIRQQDLTAVAGEELEREIGEFAERLRAWAGGAPPAAGGGSPMVSVEIPVFKGGWVMPCIESVLYQTSTRWRLSIRWDGGDALSRRILEVVARLQHPNIQVHFGENRGIAYNRRFLTEHSQGEYVLPLDDDDMLAPGAVEKFLAFVAARPWSGIARARRAFIDEVGRPVNQDPWFPFEPRHYQRGMVQDVFNHCQPMLISRSAYMRTAGWEGFEEFRCAGEDCDIFIKIEEVAPIELLDDVLYYYRLSDRRTSLVLTDRAAYEMWRRLADGAIARIGLPLERTNERPPFTYARTPRPRPGVDAIDVVVFGGPGGAAARNAGFRRSTRPLVCYVRAGIEVTPDTLGALLDVMFERDADLVGPRILSTDGSVISGASAFTEERVPIRRGLGAPHCTRAGEVVDARWLPSDLLLVRREVLNAVGGFEEGRDDLVADADFSLKARRRDFTCLYAGTVAALDRAPLAAGSAPAADVEWLTAKWSEYADLCEPLDFGEEAADFRRLYKRGVALLRDGRVETAMSAFRSVAALNSEFSWAQHSLGDALFQVERWEDAANAYRRAIELKGDVSWSHHHLANSLMKLERWQEAAAAYQRAIDIEPDVASAYTNLGSALFRLEQFEAAAAAYEQAVSRDPADFWAHYGAGESFSRLERWQDAAAAYEQALAVRSDVFWAHFNLGNAFAGLERWDAAAAAYRRAIELDPGAAEAHSKLGAALYALEEFKEASAVFRRAIELDPHDFWAPYGLGDALSRLERWSEAVRAYERAIAIRSDEFWSQYNLGDALSHLERWEPAAAAFQRASEIDAGDADSHWRLGLALIELGRGEEAVSALQRAVSSKPNDAFSRASLGNVLFTLGRWDAAAAAYQRAIDLDPEVAWYHTNLGNTFIRLQQYEDAAGAYGRVIALVPDAAAAHVDLGNALSKLERWEDAAAAYEQAIELDPRPFWAHHYLGYARLRLRQWEEAAETLSRAVAIDSGFCWSHHYLGDALAKLERWVDAEAAYRRAIDLEPGLFWSANNLGEALAKLQRWDEARAAYERAIAACPDFSLAHHNLGDALQRLGRLDAALAAYQSADDINPPWSRREVDASVAPFERWFDRLLPGAPGSAGAGPDGARLMFVLDTDYGELTTIMYMILGQVLAANTTLLMPSRLFVNNRETLPGRTEVYASVNDIVEAVDRLHPDIVFLCSAYLFSIHHICTPEQLQELVAVLTSRGCRVVTTDPFLGLLSNLGTTTRISIDIPEHAGPKEVRMKHEQDARLNEDFSKAVAVLRDLDHLYPVYPAGPGETPRAKDGRPVACFNPALLVDGAVVNGGGTTPIWVFVLASRDYELQATFHGKAAFAAILAQKLDEAVLAGRHPVLVAPYSCVQSLVAHMEASGGPAVAAGVTLMTFCPFKRFSALLLEAEYVFYWNALSHSMFLRLFNERPAFLFDRGHLVRNVFPLYERIVEWYYQGWEPVYLDQQQPLTLEALAGPAEAYRRGAHEIRGSLRRAPEPVLVVEQIRTPATRVYV
jgi:tetratricopeptide (TPR) repeat protein/glycosyltransferase involved in cell wall biosynthesis